MLWLWRWLAAGFVFLFPLYSIALVQPESRSAAAPATIVLAPLVVAGQPATLAVLTADGLLVPGASVDLPDGQRLVTDETGRAVFKAPSVKGPLLAKLPGTQDFAAAIVVSPPASSGVELQQVPRFVSVRNRFSIRGSGFAGQADENHITLGGQTALVLASSPASLVVLPAPDTPLGSAKVAVEVKGIASASPATVVGFQFDSAKEKVLPGKKSWLTLRAVGTEEPLNIEVRNLSPDIMRFVGDKPVLLKTRGGAQNSASFQIEGLVAGDFSFAVTLSPGSVGPPDVEAAEEFLQAASKEASEDQRHHLEDLRSQLQQHPKSAPQLALDLQKLFPQVPSGEFGFWIVAAYNALVGLF